MKNMASLAFVASLVFSTPSSALAIDTYRQTMNHFGNEVPEEGETINLKRAIETLDKSAHKPQKISGQVTKVCLKKGCWMILTDEDSYARITFKDYAFFVPPESGQKKSVVYGVLEQKVLSKKMAAHYAADAGELNHPAVDGKTEYAIVASGVYIEKDH